MYPYIHIVLPSYAAMAFAGGAAALCLMYARLETYQIPFTSFLRMFFFSAAGGVIGSKLLFAVTQLPWLIGHFTFKNLLLFLPQSGYVFYGGLFGVIFILLLMTRKDRDLRRRVFRLAVPAMPLFHAFGRVGCFLAGCCYGKELAGIKKVGPLEFTRIPVQLAEALAETILFVVILIVEKKKDCADLLRIYLAAYAGIRFADEFLRGDPIRGIYFGLSTAQWISLAILFFYLIGFLRGRTGRRWAFRKTEKRETS